MAYFDKYGVEFSDDKKTLIKCPVEFCGAYSIPDGVEIIDRGSFQGCSELTALSIPMSVHKIEQFAIRSCDKLSSLVIPDSITEIGNGNFYNLEDLRSIVIGDGVHYLENCFGFCGSLSSIVVNGSLRLSLINDDFFETPWYQLQPNGAVMLGATLIAYKKAPDESLTHYKVPDNVRYIACHAFNDCQELESIDFNNVQIVECSLLDRVSSIKATGNTLQETESFDNTIWFKNQPCGCVNIGSLLYRYKEEGKYPRVISIPDNTIVINKKAFYALYQYKDDTCDGIETFIVICNETLTTIGESAFEGAAISEIILPKGLRIIQDNAFRNSMLNSINLPESVEKIGEESFSECKLTNIHIPSSITYIPKRAFWRNHSLTNVSLSPYVSGVEEIGEYAFAECDIRNIYIPSSVSKIGDSAFAENYGLDGVILSEGVEIIGESAFSSSGYGKLRILEIPSTVKEIGRQAFRRFIDHEEDFYAVGGCVVEHYSAYTEEADELETLTIATDLDAFWSELIGKNLETVIFKDGITIIPKYGFNECKRLRNVIIPPTLQSVGEFAFRECESLDTLILPTNIEELWSNSLPPNIKKVVLHSGKLKLMIDMYGKKRLDYYVNNRVFVDTNGNIIEPEVVIFEVGDENEDGKYYRGGQYYDIKIVDEFEDFIVEDPEPDDIDEDGNYRSSYSQYGGYNGYDDDTINSAFEGNPEATWNVD